MESVERDNSFDDQTNVEFRVQVKSKKQVTDQINKYKEVLNKILDGQPDVDEEKKRVLLQELLANFEAAVQDNVLVNGQMWDEAPDDEKDEHVDPESMLDDAIVETSGRRRHFPRQILPHVIHSLKAQRKVMEHYEPVVKPAQLVKDPQQESIMNGLSAAAPGLVTEAVHVIKSIANLQKQAEGLCQVLAMQPSQESLQIHQEVMGCCSHLDAGRDRQPIKRMAEEAAAANCYVPLAKKTGNSDAK